MTLETKKIIAQLFQGIEENAQEVIDWRRYLHANPELSFDERETSKYIQQKLLEFGYKPITGIGGHAILARLEGAQSGPTIGLRADFDALPIQDLKLVPYASKIEGVSHACGHDGHTAALLATAKLLKTHINDLKGNIVFIFQHAEEKPPGGAKEVVENGGLEGIDAVFAAHLDSSIEVGKVAVDSGYKLAAVDYFKIILTGKGGHGAKPHETRDALVVGSELVCSLQKIVSRQINPIDPAVVTIGQFHAGSAFNVIAQNAELEGTVRTYKEETRQYIAKQIHKISEGIASAYDIDVEIDYLFGYPALFNPEEETKIVQDAVRKNIGNDVFAPFPQSMGAEDFAYFLNEKPGNYFKVGSANDSDSTKFPHHHGSFDIDELSLLITQKVFVSIIDHYLIEEE